MTFKFEQLHEARLEPGREREQKADDHEQDRLCQREGAGCLEQRIAVTVRGEYPVGEAISEQPAEHVWPQAEHEGEERARRRGGELGAAETELRAQAQEALDRDVARVGGGRDATARHVCDAERDGDPDGGHEPRRPRGRVGAERAKHDREEHREDRPNEEARARGGEDGPQCRRASDAESLHHRAPILAG